MTVLDIDELKGHTGSVFYGIFVTTGRAEAAVTTKRDEFKVSTMSAGEQ